MRDRQGLDELVRLSRPVNEGHRGLSVWAVRAIKFAVRGNMANAEHLNGFCLVTWLLWWWSDLSQEEEYPADRVKQETHELIDALTVLCSGMSIHAMPSNILPLIHPPHCTEAFCHRQEFVVSKGLTVARDFIDNWRQPPTVVEPLNSVFVLIKQALDRQSFALVYTWFLASIASAHVSLSFCGLFL